VTWTEVNGNLLKVKKDWILVHCVSADGILGAGVALNIANKYPKIRSFVRAQSPKIGDAILYDYRVFNLITKTSVYHKPTYNSLQAALDTLKRKCLEMNIKKLAMPYRIACGLDRLDWDIVSQRIKDTFKDTDIDILIVRKNF
jgi:hypothetical protein